MSPDDPRHGTEAGNEQHVRDGEEPCGACRQGDIIAARRRSKRRAMGYQYQKPLGDLVDKLELMRERGATHDDIAERAGISASQAWRCCNGDRDSMIYTRTWVRLKRMDATTPVVTTVGVQRRIRALAWLGYSYPMIAREVGCNRDTIADAAKEVRPFINREIKRRIAEVYERLEMVVPESDDRREKAAITRSRNHARKNGWHPPLSWEPEAIDDPAGQPKGGNYRPILQHKGEDLLHEWQHLRSLGVSIHSAAQQLGVTVAAIEKAMERAGRAA